MIKPKKLKVGDTVAVISPSWGGPSIFPHIYENGVKYLQQLGLKVKEYPSTKKDDDFLFKNPKFRAKDINNAFEDKGIKAIFASIGGNDSIKILPYLNLEIILNNPKIIMGYSDTSTLLTYLNQNGLVTLHGPSIMAGFCQYKYLGPQFQSHIKDILFNNSNNYQYKKYTKFCHGYLNWSNLSNVGKTNPMIQNSGWTWLQGNSTIEGKLFGGCIETLEQLKDTPFFPDANFWTNKVLFLETSEEKTNLNIIKSILYDYGKRQIFDKISALLIGRARDYSKKEKLELDCLILEIIRKQFKNKTIPIITNMDFGHTDPQWILPLGINAKINCIDQEFQLSEKIFKD
ncbi:MAG: LD-carboxypeptidase [Candidatus Cloacimonadota bacterium]|nr:MAG: LD-carboxypeptidase [Candidatus Cloacimonadota bacterium]PCJ21038.1 MAG: LD-carboxypeptidase [Candidatus Cloacimonadota bacterium]